MFISFSLIHGLMLGFELVEHGEEWGLVFDIFLLRIILGNVDLSNG